MFFSKTTVLVLLTNTESLEKTEENEENWIDLTLSSQLELFSFALLLCLSNYAKVNKRAMMALESLT